MMTSPNETIKDYVDKQSEFSEHTFFVDFQDLKKLWAKSVSMSSEN